MYAKWYVEYRLTKGGAIFNCELWGSSYGDISDQIKAKNAILVSARYIG